MRLAHPNFANEFCLFTDASDLHWGVVLTQLNDKNKASKVYERHHEPLAFLSGSFSGSQLRWSIVEKEAYPIIIALERLRHYLLNDKGFRLFTDHRNLIFIFDPTARDTDVPKQTSEKLARWAEKLRSQKFTIEHIPGECNIWADILSQWKVQENPRPSIQALRLATAMTDAAVKPDLEDMVWPDLGEIKRVQESTLDENNHQISDEKIEWDNNANVYVMSARGSTKLVVWIPNQAMNIQLRILIVAHTGIEGHRGIKTTLKNVLQFCYWTTVASDVKTFCETCLHCSVNYPQIMPRPYSETLHANKRNQVLHYDFLYIGSMNPDYQYVLVIKDDFSNYVELIKCKSADHKVVVEALLHWYSRLGIPEIHVSDNASHFKNQVIKELNRQMSIKHHYTIAYAPWTNGTVEVVNKTLLEIMRALCSEMRID